MTCVQRQKKKKFWRRDSIKNEWLTIRDGETNATNIKEMMLYCSEEIEDFLLEIRNQGT